MESSLDFFPFNTFYLQLFWHSNAIYFTLVKPVKNDLAYFDYFLNVETLFLAFQNWQRCASRWIASKGNFSNNIVPFLETLLPDELPKIADSSTNNDRNLTTTDVRDRTMNVAVKLDVRDPQDVVVLVRRRANDVRDGARTDVCVATVEAWAENVAGGRDQGKSLLKQ